MPWARSFCPLPFPSDGDRWFRAYGVSKSTSPLGVPADLQSAVKKVRPIKTGGFVIPQQKEKHTPLLRIANPQSLNRLGHFLTPDCKSGETPSQNFRLWLKNGLKAQKLLAQGNALGIVAVSKAPCKGKSFVY